MAPEADLYPVLSLANLTEISDDELVIRSSSSDSHDHYVYVVKFHPFTVKQRINNITTAIVNNENTLLMEKAKSLEFLLEEDPFKKLQDTITNNRER